MRANVTLRARRDLDQRFAELPLLREALAVPAGGWIRTVRHCLGMTLMQLGQHVGISHVAVLKLEQRELDGTITLRRLRRLAAAMQCDLFYVMLPRQGFVELVEDRARRRAAANGPELSVTMAEAIDRRQLWSLTGEGRQGRRPGLGLRDPKPGRRRDDPPELR